MRNLKKSQVVLFVSFLVVLAAILFFVCLASSSGNLLTIGFSRTPIPDPDDKFSPARIAADIKAGVCIEYGLSGGCYYSGYYEFDGTGAEKVEHLRFSEELWNARPVWADRDIVSVYSREGFNAVRFGVAFSPYMKNDTHEMDPAILDALEEYVSIILDNDMYAIFTPCEYFGFAFDGEGLKYEWMLDEYSEYIDARYAALWRQVAEQFKDYDERVIFEANNEPHFTYEPFLEDEAFGGMEAVVEIITKKINEMNHIFVNTVRQTGGNNKKRLLLLNEVNEAPGAWDRLALPDDDYIGYAPHYYPCFFGDSWDRNNECDKQELDAFIDNWKDFMETSGVPLVITEGGIMERIPFRDRLDLAEYSIDRFMELGIPWIWYGEFGDALSDPPEDRWTLYDWREERWFWPELRDIILKPTWQAPEVSC